MTRSDCNCRSFAIPGRKMPRREMLRAGGLSLLGFGLSDALRLEAATAAADGKVGSAKSCILLFLEGGPSQIDTWDPKPHSAFKPISTQTPGIQVSELFPRLAAQSNQLAIVRSVHTEEDNHPQGTHYALTGHRPSPRSTYPSFGSIIAKEKGMQNNMPPYFMVPLHWETDFFSYVDAFSSAFLGAQYNPIILPDPSSKDFEVPDLSLPKSLTAKDIEDRRAFLNVVDRGYRRKEKSVEFAQMDRFREQALKMLLSPDVKKAFDLSEEPDKTRDAYGRGRIGQSVLMARRLVEAGCRFVTASGYRHSQWDTHKDHNKILRESLAPTLDRTLSVLLNDLEERGLLESTVVIAMGEFGRTPHLNAAVGRDHYPDCWSLLLAGGGIQGGRVVGKSDAQGAQVAERLVSMGDVYATLYKALGIDWTKAYTDPAGRPLYIANGLDDVMGQPLDELF